MMQSEKAIDDIYQLFLEARKEKNKNYFKAKIAEGRFTKKCEWKDCTATFPVPFKSYQKKYCDTHRHLAFLRCGDREKRKQEERRKQAFESWDGQDSINGKSALALEIDEKARGLLLAESDKKRKELYAKYAGLRAFEHNHEPKPYTRPRLALNIERLEGIDANINQIKLDVAYIRSIIERLENESNKIWGKRE